MEQFVDLDKAKFKEIHARHLKGLATTLRIGASCVEKFPHNENIKKTFDEMLQLYEDMKKEYVEKYGQPGKKTD